MPQAITVLYTANLAGNLDLLPRLHTFIRQLKAQPIESEDEVRLCALEPVTQRTLLLDLGGACAPEVWHCAATEGRSMLLALDAMGYDALRVALSAESRARLDANFLRAALVDAEHPLIHDRIAVTADDKTPLTTHDLHIVLGMHEQTHLSAKKVRLASVQVGQIGVVQLSAENGVIVLQAHEIATLPPGMPVDPTIAATVDYVVSEARLYERKRSSSAQ